MPNDKKESSTVDFLNEIGKSEPFKEEVIPKEDNSGEEVEKEEKQLPFNKDPKVQRYIEKQVEKALKSMPREETKFREDIKDEINLPSSFVKLIGNDTEEKRQVLKDMSDYLSSLPEKAKEKFLEEQREAVQAQEREDAAAVEELNTSFEEIEENYDVDLSSNSAQAKKTRSEFVDYIRKIAPKNEDGEVVAFPDLISAFEEFQEKGKRALPNNSKAKNLASRGLTRSSDTTTEAPQGRSWKDVDRYFSKLKANNN